MTADLQALLADVDAKHHSDPFATVVTLCRECYSPWPCPSMRLAAAVREMAKVQEQIAEGILYVGDFKYVIKPDALAALTSVASHPNGTTR